MVLHLNAFRTVLSVSLAMSGRRGASASPWKAKSLRVLVDMDGVLCDFEGYFLQQYRQKFPDEPFIPLDKRRVFYIDQQYKDIKPELYEKCKSITEADGFFRNLPPINGAIDALKEMSGMEDVDVFLCTSPLVLAPRCVTEKIEWVQEHLGRAWISKLVVTKDKTVIAGDILIDDRPKIKGVDKNPSWDHILFTACHNQHLDVGRLRCVHRLDNWTDGLWKQLVKEYHKKI